MINLKLKKEESRERESILMEEPSYPYGLCIQLENEQIEALGLQDMETVGEVVSIKGMAFVKSASIDNYEGEEKHSLSLQITDLEVVKKSEEQEKESKDISQTIYGG